MTALDAPALRALALFGAETLASVDRALGRTPDAAALHAQARRALEARRGQGAAPPTILDLSTRRSAGAGPLGEAA